MAKKTYEDVFNEITDFLAEYTNVYEQDNSVTVVKEPPKYPNTIFIVDGDHFTALEVMTGLNNNYSIKVWYGIKSDFKREEDDVAAVINAGSTAKSNEFISWGSDGSFWGNIRWTFQGRSEKEVKENLLTVLLDWERGEIKRK